MNGGDKIVVEYHYNDAFKGRVSESVPCIVRSVGLTESGRLTGIATPVEGGFSFDFYEQPDGTFAHGGK